MAVQIYQLVTLIIQLNNTKTMNINYVLSINVFCMITDMYIIVMLSQYWKSIEN